MRPVEEVLEHDQSRYRFLIPLLLYNHWSVAGPVYTENSLYAENGVETDMKTLVQSVVERSGICTGTGGEYRLHIAVNHLYSVSYVKNWVGIGFGGAGAEIFDFFPCGYVELTLTLKDREGRSVSGQRTLSRSFLHNTDHPVFREEAAKDAYQEYQEQYRGLMAGHKSVVKIAIQEIVQDLIKELDRMLAADGLGAEITGPPQSFRVIRLTDEYDFCEEAVVETATGKILSSAVRKYNAPIVSRPGEWIVLPEDANGHWLAPEQYRLTIEFLSAQYNTAFEDNLSAATFRGMKKRP